MVVLSCGSASARSSAPVRVVPTSESPVPTSASSLASASGGSVPAAAASGCNLTRMVEMDCADTRQGEGEDQGQHAAESGPASRRENACSGLPGRRLADYRNE